MNILEMKDFYLVKQPIYLAKNDHEPLKGNVIFINTKAVPNVIDILNNKNIHKQSAYKYLYKEHRYVMKIFTKTHNVNIMKQRVEDYKNIQAITTDSIIGVTNFKTNHDRNIFIDISYFNELFFQSIENRNYKQVYTEYINHLADIINNAQYGVFTNKLMIINLNDWFDAKIKDVSASSLLNNPFSILCIILKKEPELIKKLGNLDILLVENKNTFIKFNASKCDEKSYSELKREVSKLKFNKIIDQTENAVNDQEQADQSIRVVAAIKNELGDAINTEVEDKIIDKVKQIEEDDTGNDNPYGTVMNNEEVLTAIAKTIDEIKLKSGASSKRDEVLREQQKKLKFKNITSLETMDKLNKNPEIIKNDISKKVYITNPNAQVISFPNFEKVYNRDLYAKDIISVVGSLNGKRIPVYIKDIKVEDSSDSLNLKETVTCTLEDGNRVRHTLKFDVPKFIDDKFMYLGGNKKMFVKQRYLIPIAKTGPDTVQVCSNYNKIFITRYGENVADKYEKFKQLVQEDRKRFGFKKGNNLLVNKNYITTIEYDNLSKVFTTIDVKDNSGKTIYKFFFNQELVKEFITSNKITVEKNTDETKLLAGFKLNGNKYEPMYINTNTQGLIGVSPTRVQSDDVDEPEDMEATGIIDFIINNSAKNDTIYEDLDSYKAGKRFMFTRCTIMKKKIPMILLLSYCEGLTTVLRKANIEHYFTDKRPSLSAEEKINKGVIPFKDGYLVYNKYPLENSLLLNGLSVVPTKTMEYEQLDDKGIYLDIFDALYGSRILANALDNFYELMLDPITVEVLDDLNYPTEFVPLMLLGNKLLADNNYTSETNQTIYRIRSNEMVYAYLYKEVAEAYAKYKATSQNKNPVKISIPKDTVIKKILTSEIVEEYSTLNPIVELEKSRAITSKG